MKKVKTTIDRDGEELGVELNRAVDVSLFINRCNAVRR